jgi:GrpB-like predicted nucleotidyltransferase (UPF0157 family)
MIVYLVIRTYNYGDSESTETIGIYSTRRRALKAANIEHAQTSIHKWELNGEEIIPKPRKLTKEEKERSIINFRDFIRATPSIEQLLVEFKKAEPHDFAKSISNDSSSQNH